MKKYKLKKIIFNKKIVLFQSFIPALLTVMVGKGLIFKDTFINIIIILIFVYPVVSLIWSIINIKHYLKIEADGLVTYISFAISAFYIGIELILLFFAFIFGDLGI